MLLRDMAVGRLNPVDPSSQILADKGAALAPMQWLNRARSIPGVYSGLVQRAGGVDQVPTRIAGLGPSTAT